MKKPIKLSQKILDIPTSLLFTHLYYPYYGLLSPPFIVEVTKTSRANCCGSALLLCSVTAAAKGYLPARDPGPLAAAQAQLVIPTVIAAAAARSFRVTL